MVKGWSFCVRLQGLIIAVKKVDIVGGQAPWGLKLGYCELIRFNMYSLKKLDLKLNELSGVNAYLQNHLRVDFIVVERLVILPKLKVEF